MYLYVNVCLCKETCLFSTLPESREVDDLERFPALAPRIPCSPRSCDQDGPVCLLRSSALAVASPDTTDRPPTVRREMAVPLLAPPPPRFPQKFSSDEDAILKAPEPPGGLGGSHAGGPEGRGGDEGRVVWDIKTASEEHVERLGAPCPSVSLLQR